MAKHRSHVPAPVATHLGARLVIQALRASRAVSERLRAETLRRAGRQPIPTTKSEARRP